MHVAFQLHGFDGLFFLHAEGQRVAFHLFAHDLRDAAQHIVGGRQHRFGGDGRTGNGLNRATAEGIQPLEGFRTGGFLPARTEASRLGKVGVADLAAHNLAVHVHAQGHGHVAAIALRGCHGAVTDRLAVLFAFHQCRHVAAFRHVQRDEGVRIHHALERSILRRFLMRLDRASRNGVRHSQRQCCHQRNQRQNQIGRKLLFRRLGFTHGFFLLLKICQ